MRPPKRGHPRGPESRPGLLRRIGLARSGPGAAQASLMSIFPQAWIQVFAREWTLRSAIRVPPHAQGNTELLPHAHAWQAATFLPSGSRMSILTSRCPCRAALHDVGSRPRSLVRRATPRTKVPGLRRRRRCLPQARVPDSRATDARRRKELNTTKKKISLRPSCASHGEI